MKKLIVILLAVLFTAASCNKTSTSPKIYKKVSDVKIVTDLRFTAQGLNDYFRDNKKFPKSLLELLNSGDYINASYPINTFSYAVSADNQHYVLAIEIQTDKDKLGPVNGRAIEQLNGNLYGIDCSNVKTFCLNEKVYMETSIR